MIPACGPPWPTGAARFQFETGFDPVRADRGRCVVGRIIDGLYDRIEKDVELRPMFTRTFTSERMKQKAFMEEWMGGEPDYTRHHAHGGIKRIREAVTDAYDRVAA